MAALSRKLRSVGFGTAGTGIGFWCPGCDEACVIRTAGDPPTWTWNGNVDAPTISPSINVTYDGADKHTICHSFVRDGSIQFLGDCTHAFAGQTIPLPDWPETETETED